MHTLRQILTSTLIILSAAGAVCCNDSPIEALKPGFENPDKDSRPLTWWHWMNGNISIDGIRKDLSWLHESGIGGVFLFDAGNFKGQIVEDRLQYMSDGWREAFRFSQALADSLGMSMSIASSPGWSITGGPWVTEDDAQKKLVWSILELKGEDGFEGTLPEPPSVAGPYQDEMKYPSDPDRYRYYRDICIIAVRKPAFDRARIVESEVKAGFRMNYKIADNYPTPDTGDVTAFEDVIDLTPQYANDTLKWQVPEGDWKVFRFGYSLLGHVNGPATPESTGLEVDKLDKSAIDRYYHSYLSMFAKALDSGAAGPESLKGRIYAMEIDSYESGRATWTPRIEQEFKARRGYSLRPWLPVLTGQIIGSSSQSERFLFDWRQTLGELMAESHYDHVNDILHPLGILRYNEAHEERTSFTGDGMMVKRSADVPMSAFWVRPHAGWYSSYPTSEADVRESSSVAHIYGQNICAAESFTTNGLPGKWDGSDAYQCHPGNLKRVADAAMACGLNKFVIHTSVHQPCDDIIPGLGLDRYGQWFNRHDTWASEARSWIDYLSRSSQMLRAGRYVADIAYFYGEDKNITGRFMHDRPEIPAGWNFDYVNADILLNVFKIKGKRLVTDSGMSYAVLRIDPEVKYMSMSVLERIAEFARNGITIIGPKPVSLANLMADEAGFTALADRIWSLPNVVDSSLDPTMAGIEADVMNLPDSSSFIHRKVKGGDIYWISNTCSRSRDFYVSLRSRAKSAQIWHADTGVCEQADFTVDSGRTIVNLKMSRDDAQFIVLSDRSCKSDAAMPFEPVDSSVVLTFDGPWHVKFQERRGAPESAELETGSWTRSDCDGIRYFSGKAEYSRSFGFRPEDGCRYSVCLGKVGNMARVILNGKNLGLLWKEPFSIDITDALQEGTNVIELHVINSWANRLIGDEQKGIIDRITWTVIPFYSADSPLPDSGLLEPVRIICTKKEN